MRKLFAVLLFLVGTFSFAQTSNVSATVTDSDGQTWNNGTYKLSFLPPSGYTGGVYTFNGAPWTPPTPVIGTLSSGGTFAYNGLQRNDYILPTGSGWTFSFCPNASFRCSPTSLVINSPTQNISSNLVLVAPRFAAGNLYLGSYGYLDVEVSPTPVTGSTYYNVIAGCQKVYNGASFACSGGGGTVNSVNASDGSLTISPNSGTVEARCTAASNSQIGCVQPDGTTTTIVGGKLVASGGSSYTLPIATTSTLGGIKPDGTTITVNDLTGVASAVSGGGVQYPAAGMLHIFFGDSRFLLGYQWGTSPPIPAGYVQDQDSGNLPMQFAKTPAAMRGQAPVVFTISGCSDNGTVATITGTGTLPMVNQVVELKGMTSTNCAPLNSVTSENLYNVSAVGSGSFSFPFVTTSFSLTADTGTATEWGLVVNLSIGAETAALAVGDYVTYVHTLAASAGQNCALYDDLAGNDILDGTANSTIEGYLHSLWTEEHADCPTIVRYTILPGENAWCGLTACYTQITGLNQWTSTQTKSVVLPLTPAATDYVDLLVPYDLAFPNNDNQVYYQVDNLHPRANLNRAGAGMGSDALVLQTDRTTGAFDPTAPGAQLPSTASGNNWNGFQTVTGSVANGLVTINDTYSGVTRPLILQGALSTDTQLYLGSNLSVPYEGALLYWHYVGFDNPANQTCIAVDGYSLGALPGLCVDGTGAISNGAARKGTFVCTSGGSIAVTNANGSATSDILITLNTAAGTLSWNPRVSVAPNGTQFTVLCAALDTSTYNYEILN